MKAFAEQEVDFSSIFPMPQNFEKLFLTLYFILIPYTVGLLFLFLFVAGTDFESFITLDLAMIVAVWAIGYEVAAASALLVIFYMFVFNKRL